MKNITEKEAILYICNHCNKKYQRKHAAINHELICTKKPENELMKLPFYGFGANSIKKLFSIFFPKMYKEIRKTVYIDYQITLKFILKYCIDFNKIL